jgi:hypothetical protein
LAVIGSTLYIGTYGDGGEDSFSAPIVYRWDGSDAELAEADIEHDLNISGYQDPNPSVVSLGVYDETELLASVGDPYAIIGSLNHVPYGHLWRRDGAGVWTELSFPPGVAHFYARGFATLGSKLYMCGTSYGNTPQDGQILSWDGATLTLEHTITPIDSDTPVIIGAMTVVGSTLYYLWTDRGVLKLGTFAGASWSNTRKDLSSQVTFTAAPALDPEVGPVCQDNMPVSLWYEDGILHAVAILGLSDHSTLNLYFLHAGGVTDSTWIVDYGPVDAGVFSWVQQHPQAVS